MTRSPGLIPELLESLTASGGTTSIHGIAEAITAPDLQVQENEAARLVYVLWQRWFRDKRPINRTLLTEIISLISTLSNVPLHLATALDYLWLWSEAAVHFDQSRFKGNYYEMVADGERMRNFRLAVEKSTHGRSTSYGALMFRAMLTSIDDRDAAAAMFRTVEAESSGFAAVSPLDQFAATYFSEGEIDQQASKVAARRLAFTREWTSIKEGLFGNEQSSLFLFSCDPVYFRVYFPYWIGALPYLADQNVSMHFVVVGERSMVDSVVDSSMDLALAVSRFRGMDWQSLSQRVSVSSVGVPAYVNDHTTFFACARYLAALKLSDQRSGRVIVLDIDMVMRDDPALFLRRVHDLSAGNLSVMVARDLGSLIPTRRYMAGTFPVPVGKEGRRAMNNLEDYIYVGLASQVSGTLDQNALAYVIERAVERDKEMELIPIGKLGQPFVQLAPVKRMYETGQRAAVAG